MRELIIDRGELLTGTALKTLDRESGLCHRTTGLKCCIGVYLSRLGVSDETLKPYGMACSIQHHVPAEAEWLVEKVNNSRFRNSSDALKLAALNDLSTPEIERLHPIRREAHIAKIFAKHNVKVTFTGSYAAGTRKAKAALKKGV